MILPLVSLTFKNSERVGLAGTREMVAGCDSRLTQFRATFSPRVYKNSMDRARKAEPRANKILYDAELRFRKECHDRKIRSVKASVDNKAPSYFGVVRLSVFRAISALHTFPHPAAAIFAISLGPTKS